MAIHTSATLRQETPHATTATITIEEALRRRAYSLINDRSIDPQWRTMIRYALEINDPWLADLVRRADAGQTSIETIDFSQPPKTLATGPNEKEIDVLAETVCRAGKEAMEALFDLMLMIENSAQPKVFANAVKQFAFARCTESNP